MIKVRRHLLIKIRHCSLLGAQTKFVNGGFVYFGGLLFFFFRLLCFVVSSGCDNVTCIGNGMCNSTAGISKGSEDKQVPVDLHDEVGSNLFYCWNF